MLSKSNRTEEATEDNADCVKGTVEENLCVAS